MSSRPAPHDQYARTVASLFGVTAEEFHAPAGVVDDVEPTAGSITGLLWQMRSRPTPAPASPPPFDTWQWPDLHHVIEHGAPDEIEAVVRHPHPGVRCVAARHPMLWSDLQGELAGDVYREVRASLLANRALAPGVLERLHADPVDTIRELADRRAAVDAESALFEREMDDMERCVECGARIKNWRFFTCSVLCSITQHHRRVASGLWVDMIAVDRRHRTGLRSDWPAPFRWRVADALKSGSAIPGIGPRTRVVLAPFVRGVRSAEIVDFCTRVREAGLDQLLALAQLAATGLSVPGSEAITRTAADLGIEPGDGGDGVSRSPGDHQQQG